MESGVLKGSRGGAGRSREVGVPGFRAFLMLTQIPLYQPDLFVDHRSPDPVTNWVLRPLFSRGSKKFQGLFGAALVN